MRRNLLRIAACGIVLTMAVGLAAAQAQLETDPDASPSQCPCFTQAQVEAIPTPYMQCAIQLLDRKWDLISNIIYEQGVSGAQADVYTKLNYGTCAYIDYNDPLTFVYFDDLSIGQALACRQYILNVIDANVDQCLLLVDETWERP